MSEILSGVFVTGSTRGLGLAIAHEFAKRGRSVVVHGRSAEQSAAVAAKLAEQYGVAVTGVGGDLADEEQAVSVFKEAEAALGTVGVLVNNAGITRDNLLLRTKSADWGAVLATNLTSAFHLSKAALRGMLRAREGRIVNMTSVVGQMGNPGQANYAASKGGLIAFTKALAREVAGKSITVNAVAPGFIETDMTRELEAPAREKLLENIPLARLGEASEVAAAVAYLASPEAGYITGQVLAINGGLYM